MLTEQQIAARKEGIGASECAIVLDMSPYCTPYELWLQKTGRREHENILSESRLRLRHAHEQTIADEYATQKGVKLRRANQTLYHDKLPFMLCHLDRVVIGQRKIVECKSSTSYMKNMWGLQGSDEVPLDYIVQVQHQYAVTGYSEADIAVLIDIDDFRIYPIQRDEAIIKMIEEKVSHFWNHHILKDIAPEATTRGDIKLMFPTNNGNFIEVDPKTLEVINNIHEEKDEIKIHENIYNDLEVDLLKFIGESDGVKQGEDVLATYIADKNGKRVLRIKKRK